MGEIEILQKIKYQYGLAILDADCGDIDALDVIKDNKATVTALDLAVSALGKQIPKKLKKADIDFTIYGCPSCDFSDSLWSCGKYDKHCPNCGQRLEW